MMAAAVVIMMGRKRSTQAWWIARCGVSPWFLCASSAKSIIMMAFFFTMPISMITPIIAITLRSILNSISVRSAPTPAAGSPDRIVIGWMKLS